MINIWLASIYLKRDFIYKFADEPSYVQVCKGGALLKIINLIVKNLENAFSSYFQLEKCLLKANVFNATLE